MRIRVPKSSFMHAENRHGAYADDHLYSCGAFSAPHSDATKLRLEIKRCKNSYFIEASIFVVELAEEFLLNFGFLLRSRNSQTLRSVWGKFANVLTI